jgi:hypothetical protein
MNSKNGLGKLYDRLTPEERFRLDVEAMARGDTEESERLTSTCPRHTYTMTDRGFSRRWDGALQLTMAALLDLRQFTCKLRMIDAFRVALPYTATLAQNDAAEAYFDGHRAGSRFAWSKAGKEGDPPGWEADDEEAEENADPKIEEDLDRIEARVEEATGLTPRTLERLERDLAAPALAAWEAFCGFCEEEMELPAEKLLQATFTPMLEEVRWFEEKVERLGLEADQAAVEEYREHMRGHWGRQVNR